MPVSTANVLPAPNSIVRVDVMALLQQNGTIIRRWPSGEAVVQDYLLHSTDPRDLIPPLRASVRKHVESALILCNGKQKEAARRLGISHQGLRQMQRRWLKEDGEPPRRYGKPL